MEPLIGGGVAACLTLCVLSRAIGDNPFYRLALSLLVGIALGYVTAVTLRAALVPALDAMLYGRATDRQWAVTITGLGLGLLLVTRLGRQRGSYLANLPLALLFGLGAAIALIGAVRGTLVPQLLATVRHPLVDAPLRQQIGGVVLVGAALVTLLGFRYSSWVQPDAVGALAALRRAPGRLFRAVGRVLILIAFGVFFAAAITTYVSALVGQLAAISAWVESLLLVLLGS